MSKKRWTSARVDLLVADVGQMSQELQTMARNDKDPARRKQAMRWRRTIGATLEYAVACRENARRRE